MQTFKVMQKQPSIYLQLRRFRRRLKSKEKIKKNRIRRQERRVVEKNLHQQGASITTLDAAYKEFLPRNIKYLLEDSSSPFNISKLTRQKYDSKKILVVPKEFSIIYNPEESYEFLRQLLSVFYYQECDEISIDYKDCDRLDLLTQIVLDAILLDISQFLEVSSILGLGKLINVTQLSGHYQGKEQLKKIINSVGSPVVLLNRKANYKNVLSYNLRCLDGLQARNKVDAQQEYDATTLLQYVNRCLSRLNKSLSRDALRELGNIIGETIINAEEHSSLRFRYLVGYFEETEDQAGSHFGILNLAIFNFGQSIYEKFKNPIAPINEKAKESMQALSSLFIKKGFLRRNDFTEETLWTLYALQGGVTSVPNQKRGDGTIRFLDSFFRVKGDSAVDNESHLYLLSGWTRIDFDGTYKPIVQKDKNGDVREIISFNESGSFEEKPDPSYVKSTDSYFPGTAIFAKLRIDDKDIIPSNEEKK